MDCIARINRIEDELIVLKDEVKSASGEREHDIRNQIIALETTRSNLYSVHNNNQLLLLQNATVAARLSKNCFVKVFLSQSQETINLTFTEGCDLLAFVRATLTRLYSKDIPRSMDLSYYRLYDSNGATVADFGSLVAREIYYFCIPNVLEAVSANNWTQRHLNDLGITVTTKSTDEFLSILSIILNGEAGSSSPQKQVQVPYDLINDLKPVSETFLANFDSKHLTSDQLSSVRENEILHHPIVKALVLVRKYSNLDAGVDSFVQLLLFYLGYYGKTLFAFPRLQLPLRFGSQAKEAIADFVILDVFTFFRMAVIEDKSTNRETVDSEPQLIAEAIASCQQNQYIEPPSKKQKLVDDGCQNVEDIFGVRVSGTFFYFYIIPVSTSVLTAMESMTATSVETKVIKVERILNFLVDGDRETMIHILCAMKTILMDQSSRHGRRNSNCN